MVYHDVQDERGDGFVQHLQEYRGEDEKEVTKGEERRVKGVARNVRIKKREREDGKMVEKRTGRKKGDREESSKGKREWERRGGQNGRKEGQSKGGKKGWKEQV